MKYEVGDIVRIKPFVHHFAEVVKVEGDGVSVRSATYAKGQIVKLRPNDVELKLDSPVTVIYWDNARGKLVDAR